MRSQFACALDVGAVHRFGIANPEPVVRGDMNHSVASIKSGTKCIRLQQVALVRLATNAFKIFKVACLAHQHAQLRALADKRSCDGGGQQIPVAPVRNTFIEALWQRPS